MTTGTGSGTAGSATGVGVTVTVGGGISPPTKFPPPVAIAVPAGDPPAAHPSGPLPFTGAEITLALALALALILAGAVFLLAGRRRSPRP